MAFSVQMPALGESVTEGTVTRWLKQEGDRVEVDEPLLEVSTDKVDTEIPSPAAGVLQRIVAGEDEIIEVGGELALIGDADESPAPDAGAEAPPAASAQAPAEAETGAQEPAAPANQAATAPSDEQEQEQEQEQPAQAPQAAAASSAQGSAVSMPELGESVTEGTVTRWLKQIGDRVEVDEPLLEVSTDKVDTEIPSPVAGTLLEITANEDDTVEVGGQLAVVGEAAAQAAQPEQAPAPQRAGEQEPQRQQPEERSSGEGAAAEAAPADGGTQRAEAPSAAPAGPAAEQGGEGDGRPAGGAPYVTPLVRKLAAEHDVDLTALAGSGVGGRIRKQDVLAAAEAKKPAPEPEPAPAAAQPSAPSAPAKAPSSAPARQVPRPTAGAPEPGTTVKMPRLRQVIAQRMTESLRISAQLTTVQEVDVTRIAALRAKAKAEFERREGVKLTFLPFFAKATVEALKAFPQVNSSINEETKEVTYHGGVHLAIAVDTPRGLVVPVIKNAEDLNIGGLARRIADIAQRTRDNKIGPDELSGGTFTITNIGSAGALFDTPIINQPQVGILGTGKITKQATVVTGPEGEDAIAVRSMCFLPLTYDHRIVDGADAGRFVAAIKARLEEGDFETDLGV